MNREMMMMVDVCRLLAAARRSCRWCGREGRSSLPLPIELGARRLLHTTFLSCRKIFSHPHSLHLSLLFTFFLERRTHLDWSLRRIQGCTKEEVNCLTSQK